MKRTVLLLMVVGIVISLFGCSEDQNITSSMEDEQSYSSSAVQSESESTQEEPKDDPYIGIVGNSGNGDGTGIVEGTGDYESTEEHVHSYDGGQVTVSPTCIYAGTKIFTCTSCGASRTEAISTTAHNYSQGKCTECRSIMRVYSTSRYLENLEGVNFTYTGIEYTGSEFKIMLSVENTTNEYVTVQAGNYRVNGHDNIACLMSKVIMPNKTETAWITVAAKEDFKKDLAEYGEDIVERIDFNLRVWFRDRPGHQIFTSSNLTVIYPYQ